MENNENKDSLSKVNPKIVEWMKEYNKDNPDVQMFGKLCGKGANGVIVEVVEDKESLEDLINDNVVIEPKIRKISKRTKERGLTIKHNHGYDKEKRGFFFHCVACGRSLVYAQLGEDMCSGCISMAYDTTYQPEYVHGHICDDSGSNSWDENSNLKEIGE